MPILFNGFWSVIQSNGLLAKKRLHLGFGNIKAQGVAQGVMSSLHLSLEKPPVCLSIAPMD
jgi:hypothetical protein